MHQSHRRFDLSEDVSSFCDCGMLILGPLLKEQLNLSGVILPEYNEKVDVGICLCITGQVFATK